MMKTKLASIFTLLMIVAISCNTLTNTNTSNTIKNGTWRITYYYDTDHEETSSYSGFNFTFASNGTVAATNGIITVNGTWTTGSDDSQVKLILNFGSTVPFDELNDDWHVTELTDVLVKMDDVSGGGGGTDYLTFEKN